MRLALVRELLGSGPVLARIGRMALFERSSHRIALLGRARAQRDIMLVLSVEVLVLRDGRAISPRRAESGGTTRTKVREMRWEGGLTTRP